MKNKRWGDVFWAFVLASTLSFAGVGCVTSGFALKNIDIVALLLVSLGGSLVWAVASRYRYGALIAAAVMEIIWLLPNASTVIESEKVLLYQISRALNLGYGWPVLYWDRVTPDVTAQPALVLIVLLVSLAVAWTVMRQKKATVAAIVAFLPMMVCLILTDTVPDNDYLMLMLGGLVLLALTNPLRCMNARQANRATAVLLIPVLLATMGLFAVVPREDYTPNQSAFEKLEQWLEDSALWQWLTGSGPSWSMGDSGADEVSLDTLGGKSDSDQTAFYVTSTKAGYLYLRGRGYDTYDGKHWTASEASTTVDNGWGPVYSNAAKVTVRMEHAREFYYFPGETGPTNSSRYFEQGMLPNTERKKEYSFYWGAPMPTRESLSGEVRQQYLQLPEETAAWAEKVLLELDVYAFSSKTGIANRIGRAVSDTAQYSLDPGRMPVGESDFARWFYTEAESGYCIHFATTATVLLRAAGIPARYVTGYTMKVPLGTETAVPQSRSHAWVEYYDDGVGWTILDPTPGYNDQPAPTLPPTEPTTEPTERPTEPTSRPTVPTEPTTQPTVPSETQPTLPGRPTPVPQKDDGFAGKLIAVLLWIVGVCAAVWGQYRLRIGIRKWYTHRGNANRQALARWRSVRIRSRIFRKKVPKKLHSLAEKAKFSQHTLTEEELGTFDSYMAKLAASLRKKPWLIRWLLRLTLAIE